jgi:hypothetical protein
VDVGALIKFFVESPGATVAVVEAAAIGYLFRELMKSHASTLETATKVLPVAEKLAQGMEALERMARRDDR